METATLALLTIANAQSASNAVEVPPHARNVAFYMPAAWTAAGLAVQFARIGFPYGEQLRFEAFEATRETVFYIEVDLRVRR